LAEVGAAVNATSWPEFATATGIAIRRFFMRRYWGIALCTGIGSLLAINFGLQNKILLQLFSNPAASEGVTEEFVLPDDANVVSVKAYGAKGDGKTDDTNAIQTAIQQTIHKSSLLYFPDGTYLVSKTLEWRNARGQWDAHLTLQGHSQAHTVIKLRDRTFTRATGNLLPAVIRTASGNGHADGGGNQAFSNSIRDMTIDTGNGNSAAVGIDYIANNQGCIDNVTVRSGDHQGAAGISMRRYGPGPLLIKNILIDGFNYGIDVSQWEYSQTYEHIILRNQLRAGVHNLQNVLTFRDLKSNNTVPAIQAEDNSGMIVLLDSNLTGGSPDNFAIEFKGALYARNLKTSGYKAAIKDNNHNRVIAAVSQNEFVSHPVQQLFDSSSRSLNLPIEETPEAPLDNPANWVKVEKIAGAKDDAAAVQAAIDTAARQGKQTVYFPNSNYKIGSTISVHGSVQHIIGLESRIEVIDPLKRSTAPVFRFERLTGKTVTLERFFFTSSNISCYLFEQASSVALVLKNILAYGGKAYRNTVSSSPYAKLFLEDVAANNWYFSNQQQVWARQLNPEGRTTKILNDNSKLWVLGIKTEGKGTVIETSNGGYTEVLGGELYPLSASSDPAFINTDSNISLVYAETGNKNYSTYVRETRHGVTREQTRTANARAGLPRAGRAMPLYVGK
jgi:hypothetical protein